jgi:drug/metabolite transporter (DMT)-like permease
MQPQISRRGALLLFAVIVIAWGLTWTVTKILVQSVSPLWITAIRSAIATVALAVLLFARGEMIVPRRGDLPMIFVTSIFHMVAFSALVAFGLQFAAVGRSIVLGYTTPLWVAPAAWLLLEEPLPPRRIFGIALGLAGLLFMFNPHSFDWHDGRAWLGNGMLLLSALAWSASILYTRAHRWISTPFQLVLWEVLLATSVLTVLALLIEGPPRIAWNTQLVWAFAYNGVVGTALAYWAMTVVNRHVPATTASLGVLITPVVGMAMSALALGEHIDADLIGAAVMITLGIAIATLTRASKANKPG